jgi:hypothetical protein
MGSVVMGFRGVFILLSVSMITMYSCVLGRDTAKSGMSEITFGSGGGVTGRVVLYRLRPNGTVYNDNNECVTKLTKKETAYIYGKLSKYADYRYDNPSNMSCFIVITSKRKENRIVWAVMGDPHIESEVVELYERFMSKIDTK